MTRVINIHHGAPYDVYIGRGSKWGNPYSHLAGTRALFQVATREEAIQKYREVCLPKLASSISELRGKTLGCFCKPKDCHGDLLAALADAS